MLLVSVGCCCLFVQANKSGEHAYRINQNAKSTKNAGLGSRGLVLMTQLGNCRPKGGRYGTRGGFSFVLMAYNQQTHAQDFVR